MEPSDEALLRACRNGDEDAWGTLVERYQRLVYSIPHRAGLSNEAAADVFQSVFTILVEQVERIEQPERLVGWIITTAQRETWRVSRNERSGQRSEVGDEELQYVSDAQPLPDEVTLRLELQHEVRTAIDALDERCRTLLRLLYYRTDTIPYSEIAATLGTTEGSIGPTRARCLQKLRRLLPERS